MIFIVHTASANYNNGFIDPVEKWQYIEGIGAKTVYEACRKMKKEHPDRVFLDYWEKAV